MGKNSIFLLAVLAVAFLFLAGCNGTNKTKGMEASDYEVPQNVTLREVEGNSSLLVYDNPQAGYYIVFHKGWALNFTEDGKNVRFTAPGFEPTKEGSPNVQLYYSPPAKTPVTLLEFTKNYLGLVPEGVEILDEGEVLFGGNQAYSILEISKENPNIKTTQVWTVYKGRTYVGAYSASKAEYDVYLPEALRTLESLALYVDMEGQQGANAQTDVGMQVGAGTAGGQTGVQANAQVGTGQGAGGYSGIQANVQAGGVQSSGGQQELTDFEKQLQREREMYSNAVAGTQGTQEPAVQNEVQQNTQENVQTEQNLKQASPIKPNPIGSWRMYSSRTDYAGAITAPSSRKLELSGSGGWQYGSSSGTWIVSPITAQDWENWGVDAYGPNYKIVLNGWNSGTGSGPIETEEDGTVDFLWAIYESEGGQAQIKFGK